MALKHQQNFEITYRKQTMEQKEANATSETRDKQEKTSPTNVNSQCNNNTSENLILTYGKGGRSIGAEKKEKKLKLEIRT